MSESKKERKPLHAWARVAALALALFALHAALPLTRRAGTALAGHILLAGLYLASLLLVLWLLATLCQLKLGPGAELVAFFGLAAALLVTRPLLPALLASALGGKEAGEAVLRSLRPLACPRLGNVILILAAGMLGRLAARLVREKNLLLPVAVVASLVDFVGVYWGVVATMEKTAPEVVKQLSAQTPVELPAGSPVPTMAMAGMGDFLFLALFFAIVQRFGMRLGRTVWASLAALAAAHLAFALSDRLPGLPFISAGVLAANWREMSFTPQEKRALAIAGAIVLIALGAILGLRFALAR